VSLDSFLVTRQNVMRSLSILKFWEQAEGRASSGKAAEGEKN
jgi:hypothetical protein